jgi:hypothetical protein
MPSVTKDRQNSVTNGDGLPVAFAWLAHECPSGGALVNRPDFATIDGANVGAAGLPLYVDASARFGLVNTLCGKQHPGHRNSRTPGDVWRRMGESCFNRTANPNPHTPKARRSGPTRFHAPPPYHRPQAIRHVQPPWVQSGPAPCLAEYSASRRTRSASV